MFMHETKLLSADQQEVFQQHFFACEQKMRGLARFIVWKECLSPSVFPGEASTTAEELLDEACAVAMSSFDCFDPLKKGFDSWFAGVLFHVAHKKFSKQHYQQYVVTSSYDQLLAESQEGSIEDLLEHVYAAHPFLDPAYYVERQEERKTMDLALAQLKSEKERQTLILHFFQGQTSQEIAQTLQCTVDNVYVWMSRGKSHLRTLYKSW